VPRLISVIADNALLGGFAAGTKPVPASIVRDVSVDLQLERPEHGLAPALAAGPAVGLAPVLAAPAGPAVSRLAVARSARSLFEGFMRRRRATSGG
jgi:hypothetical protein